jgi:hypothetical protein
MFLKIKNEIYKFIRTIDELNIDSRILIPHSTEFQNLASELNKRSKINIEHLHKSLNENLVLFILDRSTMLNLEFRENDDKKFLFYSTKEQQVQSYIVLLA